jgi:hypothetical protein
MVNIEKYLMDNYSNQQQQTSNSRSSICVQRIESTFSDLIFDNVNIIAYDTEEQYNPIEDDDDSPSIENKRDSNCHF